VSLWGTRRSDVDAIEPRSGAIGSAGQIHQSPLIQEDRMAHFGWCASYSFLGAPTGFDAPDVQFVGGVP